MANKRSAARNSSGRTAARDLSAATAGNMGGGTAKPALQPGLGENQYRPSGRPTGNIGADGPMASPGPARPQITTIPIQTVQPGQGTANQQLGGQDTPAYENDSEAGENE